MEKEERIKAIRSKNIRFEAVRGQYWVRRGIHYELWDETDSLPRVVYRFPANKVLICEPFDE